MSKFKVAFAILVFFVVLIPAVGYAQCCEYTGQDQKALNDMPAPLPFNLPGLGSFAAWRSYSVLYLILHFRI